MPRPPSQPTNAGDTAGQKHTHPKVREGQQGDHTFNPSRHHRNCRSPERREGLSPTHVTREAEGQTPGDLKTLREPAAGKTAHSAGPKEEHGTWEKTKWRIKEPSNPTPGVDQQAGARHADAPGRVQNPDGEAAEGEATQAQGRNPRGEQDICTKTPPTAR